MFSVLVSWTTTEGDWPDLWNNPLLFLGRVTNVQKFAAGNVHHDQTSLHFIHTSIFHHCKPSSYILSPTPSSALLKPPKFPGNMGWVIPPACFVSPHGCLTAQIYLQRKSSYARITLPGSLMEQFKSELRFMLQNIIILSGPPQIVVESGKIKFKLC